MDHFETIVRSVVDIYQIESSQAIAADLVLANGRIVKKSIFVSSQDEKGFR